MARIPNSIRAQLSDVSGAPAEKYVPVTKANADLPDGACRAMLCGTAGTVNLTDLDGVARDNFPLQQGYNPISALRVRTGGTADNIWALY